MNDVVRYIQDNYSKIQNVEKELASLALEVKLTAGPKKAGTPLNPPARI